MLQPKKNQELPCCCCWCCKNPRIFPLSACGAAGSAELNAPVACTAPGTFCCPGTLFWPTPTTTPPSVPAPGCVAGAPAADGMAMELSPAPTAEELLLIRGSNALTPPNDWKLSRPPTTAALLTAELNPFNAREFPCDTALPNDAFDCCVWNDAWPPFCCCPGFKMFVEPGVAPCAACSAPTWPWSIAELAPIVPNVANVLWFAPRGPEGAPATVCEAMGEASCPNMLPTTPVFPPGVIVAPLFPAIGLARIVPVGAKVSIGFWRVAVPVEIACSPPPIPAVFCPIVGATGEPVGIVSGVNCCCGLTPNAAALPVGIAMPELLVGILLSAAAVPAAPPCGVLVVKSG